MTIDYKNLEWRNTEPGLWSRDVDEIELFYATIAKMFEGSGRMMMAVTGHISLQIAVPEGTRRSVVAQKAEAALRKAWVSLRHAHPSIASQAVEDPKANRFVKIYRSDDGTWLEKTFIPVSGQTSADFANSDIPATKIPTLFVLTPPNLSQDKIHIDLFLRAPHDVLDGIGTMMAFNNYLSFAAEAYEKGDLFQTPLGDNPHIAEYLSPPYRVAVGVPAIPTEAMQTRLAKLAAAHQASMTGKKIETVGVPYSKGKLVPGKHQRAEIMLSSEKTARLISLAKNMGATITHVYHAAIALVVRDLQQRSKEERHVQYIGYLLRNERGHCKPPYNDHRHPAAAYHSISGERMAINMTVPAAGRKPDSVTQKEEFIDVLDQIKQAYQIVRDDAEHSFVAPFLWTHNTPPISLQKTAGPMPIPPPEEIATASISSIGRVDGILAEKAGAFEVYNPWVTGEELRSAVGYYLCTFRGQLTFYAAYNEAWHSAESTMDLLQRCQSLVEKGLGM